MQGTLGSLHKVKIKEQQLQFGIQICGMSMENSRSLQVLNQKDRWHLH